MGRILLLVLAGAVGLVVVPTAGCDKADCPEPPPSPPATATLSAPPCFVEVARRLAHLGPGEVDVTTTFPDAKALAEGRPIVVEGKVAQGGEIRLKRAGIEAELGFSRFVIQRTEGVTVTDAEIDRASRRAHAWDSKNENGLEDQIVSDSIMMSVLHELIIPRLAIVDGCEVDLSDVPSEGLPVPGNVPALPADVRGLVERADAMRNAWHAAVDRRDPLWEGYRREERRLRIDAYAAWLKHYARLLRDARTALTR